MEDITKKTGTAFKWSALSEILGKLITPVVNMILARILLPEEFGVLATVTMIISFAEIFVESGFQKFLIHYEFESPRQEKEYMSTALWTNLFFSTLIWLVIILFRNPLAVFVGNPEIGFPIAVTGVTLPLYGLIGVQGSRLNKDLNFKAVFWVRIISALVPVFVTLPLALLGFSFWSLIIGNIAGVAVRSALLSAFSKFKPMLFFDFKELKHMFSYGIWTMLDGVAIWATSWIDSFIISTNMSEHELGLYKNSNSIIVSLFMMVTSALNPVLFSSLSKIQNDDDRFREMFLSVQKILCMFLLPLGLGMWFYRDFVTSIILGEKWIEAVNIVGIMSLTTALRTIFISFYGDIYRAKGHFQLPLILQVCELAVLVPACIISVKHGFWALVYTRALLKLDLIIPEMVILWITCKVSPLKTFKTLSHPIAAVAVMCLIIPLLRLVGNSFVWNLLSVIVCAIIYFCVIFAFRDERQKILYPILRKIKR